MKKSTWRQLKRWLTSRRQEVPTVIPEREHAISEADISPNALSVLHRLQSLGYSAYLVGGSVRDLLLGQHPKDFDVATNARPEEVRQVFRNSRLIGRRFRLVHVYFRHEIVEVSTFRANAEESLKNPTFNDTKGKRPAMLLQDNTFGTIEEDAWRRDFTINALYYHAADRTVIDYTGGVQDLRRRVVCIIGDPVQRFHEDPIRLLRAIRMAAKLDFKMETLTHQAVGSLQSLLRHVPAARLFDEVIKLFFEGHTMAAYQQLQEAHYMHALFPDAMMDMAKSPIHERLILLAMEATDQRFTQGQSLNPGFLFSVLLWPVVQHLMQEHLQQHKKWFPALHYGMVTALERQLKTLLIPRRLTMMMRSLWVLQYHLERRRANRIEHIFHQRYFRAAFDLLKLRQQAGESVRDVLVWWDNFQRAESLERRRMIELL
ncbi:MAG: hypothetical protein A3F41_04050 [Coxiella sp. RIFCSPHIGHO2_12_FULL_44_14]|nr:MAG: hypothetical protein A3F41_04050 [Coxiella sp. RIFCSPHIGHO2_12_FULL_44_14]